MTQLQTLIEEIHLNMLDLRLKRWAELLEIQERQIEMLKELVGRTGEAMSGQAAGPDAASE